MNPGAVSAVVLAVLLLPLTAQAKQADRNQPMDIDAGRTEGTLDHRSPTVLSNGVIITQGSMKITGNTVTITRNAAGEIDVVTSVGNLAYFEQLQKAASELSLMDETKKDVVYEMGVLAEKMGRAQDAIGYFKEIYAVDIKYRDITQRIEAAYQKK